MSWADNYIKKLQDGETFSFRPRGNSMTGLIDSGELVTVTPWFFPNSVKVRDIVLCKVKGSHYLHLVTAIDLPKNRYQISNNHGRINGWISRGCIFGKVIEVRT